MCEQWYVKVESNAPTKAPTKAATQEEYDDTDVSTTMTIMNNKESEIVDFATSGRENAVFNNACENTGGRYVELIYEAICEKEGAEPITVFVSGHLSCYAIVCKADLMSRLFLRTMPSVSLKNVTPAIENAQDSSHRKFRHAQESSNKKSKQVFESPNRIFKQAVNSRPTLLMTPWLLKITILNRIWRT